MKPTILALLCAILATPSFAADTNAAPTKKIVFLAGKPSHGPGQHEHRAGCLLLQSCLTNVPGVTSVVVSNGWPSNLSVFEGAAAVVVYCDGGKNHPLIQEDRLKVIGNLVEQGTGIVLLHYGVEPTIEKGQAEFIDWVGGCFEIHWSVNPTWVADFKTLPVHAIANGVKPFKLRDEWYFHMRFRDGMRGVMPILSAVPTPGTIKRDDGPHENNPTVRDEVERGLPQHVAWAAQRANHARGFGFTGGHYHENWRDDNFRKLVLNAILWVAKIEVPPDGVQSTVTEEQIKANLDTKGTR